MNNEIILEKDDITVWDVGSKDEPRYVIANCGTWLPGAYAELETAFAMAHLNIDLLQTIWDKYCPKTITTEDARYIRSALYREYASIEKPTEWEVSLRQNLIEVGKMLW